ncbi:MAG: hypothetical protein Fur0025_36890 [Oscillatoriaceae cyanobacterium]
MTYPFSIPPGYRKYRIALLASIAFIVPFGLATKFYRGPGQAWLNDSFGGVPYEIFWILLVVFIWPQLSAARAALLVFITTCFLEFLQLWHPPFLEAIRANFFGRLVLGTTFIWWDFPYYVIGSFAGWAWVEAIGRITHKKPGL